MEDQYGEITKICDTKTMAEVIIQPISAELCKYGKRISKENHAFLEFLHPFASTPLPL